MWENSLIKYSKKIISSKILDAKELNDSVLNNFDKTKCFIIDNYQINIDEKLFYTILNQSKQYDNYIVVNSTTPLKNMKFKLKDLQSRTNSFVGLGIELPTDDLLRNNIQIFFRKQIDINPKISEYIIKNIERSYDKVFKLIKEIDDLSLSSGKSININLIKKSVKK